MRTKFDSPDPVHRVGPTWGRPLPESDYKGLDEQSWISRESADKAMLRRVNSEEGREAIGQKRLHDCAGILIPYYLPGVAYPHSYRLRRDNPEFKVGKDGKLKPDGKYLGAPGANSRLYFPPGVTPEQLQDAVLPIVIVEGEKKALALHRLAYHGVEKPRFIAVGIPGVWNWQGTVGKAGGPRGERVDVKGPINDLNRLLWKGRMVFILFDANVTTNDSVKWARKKLAGELAARHAKVKFINLPEGCGVNGVDDLLAAWGPERVLELFDDPTEATLPVVLTPQFQDRVEGMFRVTTRGQQLVETQLTNYRASIVTDTYVDDGVEIRRQFEIDGELNGRGSRISLMAAQFAPMNWPIDYMGPYAITFPNQKENARAAIQSFSGNAKERRVYAHSGWRRVDGRWLFLHAGGAIDASGGVPGVDVQLPSALSRYELCVPSTLEVLAEAVKSSWKVIDLAKPSIAFPLMAAISRAVLGDCDFALHLAGETGAFKSEVAALFQQFFGAGMDRMHLPGSWASTANALETLAFHAKDMLVVIDDFAPQGSSTDVARYHAAADRVFRSAGNQSGRGRLDCTARLREMKPPRALVLSTGEDIPRGLSIRARLLILEVSKGEINAANLSLCQAAARAGNYTKAMSGFVRWVAARLDSLRASFEQRVAEIRARIWQTPAHARIPHIIANLQAASDLYIEFSIECGAVSAGEGEQLRNACRHALNEAALLQDKYHAASEPAARFVSLVRASLSSGQAHLAGPYGGAPRQSPEDCGWRRVGHGEWSPQGNCIGWTDESHIYIEPTTAYQIIQVAGRNAGEIMGISEQTLSKRLSEKGLLASTEKSRGTNTIRRKLAGSQKDVLHFDRNTLLPTDQMEGSE